VAIQWQVLGGLITAPVTGSVTDIPIGPGVLRPPFCTGRCSAVLPRPELPRPGQPYSIMPRR
jgi:hypothetical protein